jgi:hypothetical protein
MYNNAVRILGVNLKLTLQNLSKRRMLDQIADSNACNIEMN